MTNDRDTLRTLIIAMLEALEDGDYAEAGLYWRTARRIMRVIP